VIVTAIALHLRQIQTAMIMVMIAAVLMASLSITSGLTEVILAAISDAYIQVSTFVAATLFVFFGLEKVANIDAEKMLMQSGRKQVFYAALLGALPGCGGAIIVITQYVTGRLSFGAVTAALTATMGDAAFLLIAQEPVTGIAIMAMGFGVGTVSGYIVDFIHGPGFLRQRRRRASGVGEAGRLSGGRHLERLWLVLIIPGFVLGILTAFQVDCDALFGTAFLPNPTVTIGAAGGVLSVLMFAVPRLLNKYIPAQEQHFPPSVSLISRVISDTNFVTAWVVLAFLMFEVSVYGFGINLEQVFRGYVIFTPMIALLLGFIPGCGPQVLVTTLYLSGAIPLSAQISNAISNDGDALFPAIAIAPKVAVVATLYSAIPALLFGYGWMLLVEGI
jgi:hypothetical protein